MLKEGNLCKGFLKSPVGILEIIVGETAVHAVRFTEDEQDAQPLHPDLHPVLKEALAQLNAYFGQRLRVFDLPLKPAGSMFQKQVWDALTKIPYGNTVTYGKIALELSSPDVVRAVGNANGQNPIAIIIPCHRVIGSNGKLTGYAGGLWRKKWLLEHEGSQLKIVYE